MGGGQDRDEYSVDCSDSEERRAEHAQRTISPTPTRITHRWSRAQQCAEQSANNAEPRSRHSRILENNGKSVPIVASAVNHAVPDLSGWKKRPDERSDSHENRESRNHKKKVNRRSLAITHLIATYTSTFEF